MLLQAIDNCKRMMEQRGYTMSRDWFDAPWTSGKISDVEAHKSSLREDEQEDDELLSQHSEHPSDDAASIASDISVADEDAEDASETDSESDHSLYLDVEEDVAHPCQRESTPYDDCGQQLCRGTNEGDADILRVIQQRREAYLPIATWNRGADDSEETCFLYVNQGEKFGIRDLRSVIDSHSTEQHVMIVLCEQGETIYCSKQLDAQGLRGCINVFRMSEMQIDRAQMVHIPPHGRCTPAQRREVLERFGLTEKSAVTQLPMLRQDDIMCRYYNFRPGDLVCIDRQYAQQVVRYYRLVQ